MSCSVRLRLKHRQCTFVVLPTGGTDEVLSCLVRLRLNHREWNFVVPPTKCGDMAWSCSDRLGLNLGFCTPIPVGLG